MKSKVLIIILAALYVFVLFNRIHELKNTSLKWDRLGYYSYLPAVFIYKDISSLSFYSTVTEKYNLTGDQSWYALFPQANSKNLNKYNVGSALFELPFFLAAHFFTLYSDAYEADGFSHPYQLAVAFSTIFWVIFGLSLLRGTLKKLYPDNIVVITLLCLGIGTNLYNYTAFDHGMSHPYSFFLFCCVLYLTDAWYQNYRSKYAYLLGIVLGLVAITRPVNIIVAIIPLLWQVSSFTAFQQRLRLFAAKWRQLVIAVLLFLIVSMIQLAYWKYITGHWLYDSYEGDSFVFLRPQIWNGLFSYQKGWFVYTPMAFLGMLGLYSLWKSKKLSVLPFLVFFTVFIYVVFSWKNWWYGGSFGSRPMIEALAVLSFPFAALCNHIYHSRWLLSKLLFSAIVLFFIVVNLYQTYQASYGIIHWDRMSKEYYWRTFLKMRIKEEDFKLLLKEEDLRKYLD